MGPRHRAAGGPTARVGLARAGGAVGARRWGRWWCPWDWPAARAAGAQLRGDKATVLRIRPVAGPRPVCMGPAAARAWDQPWGQCARWRRAWALHPLGHTEARACRMAPGHHAGGSCDGCIRSGISRCCQTPIPARFGCNPSTMPCRVTWYGRDFREPLREGGRPCLLHARARWQEALGVNSQPAAHP